MGRLRVGVPQAWFTSIEELKGFSFDASKLPRTYCVLVNQALLNFAPPAVTIFRGEKNHVSDSAIQIE
jgi:hypothetical protein